MMQILRRHSFSLVFASILLVYFLFFTGQNAEIHNLSGYTMGTGYKLQIVDIPSARTLQEIESAVSLLLDRLDKEIFSTYVADSELSRFNQAPVNQVVDASSELISVLDIAQQVSSLSGGAFDISVGPLVNLWGFGPQLTAPALVPDQSAIDEFKNRVGYHYLQVDTEHLQLLKTRPLELDLSAIAKGYAVDELADYFDKLGIENYFLEVGGELKIKGFKPGRHSWIPAIEKPVAGQLQIQEIFSNQGQELALAGSGDYRNYFEDNGVRYSHEIDPRTGRPISHNLAAVYVIHKQVVWADALATAFMIMGLEQGIQLADELELAVYFISRNAGGDFVSSYTEQFAAYLQTD